MTTRFADHLLDGTHAARPAATAVPEGTLYSCTTHGLIYQSDGATWATYATLGTSDAGPGTDRSGTPKATSSRPAPPTRPPGYRSASTTRCSPPTRRKPLGVKWATPPPAQPARSRCCIRSRSASPGTFDQSSIIRQLQRPDPRPHRPQRPLRDRRRNTDPAQQRQRQQLLPRTSLEQRPDHARRRRSGRNQLLLYRPCPRRHRNSQHVRLLRNHPARICVDKLAENDAAGTPSRRNNQHVRGQIASGRPALEQHRRHHQGRDRHRQQRQLRHRQPTTHLRTPLMDCPNCKKPLGFHLPLTKTRCKKCGWMAPRRSWAEIKAGWQRRD